VTDTHANITEAPPPATIVQMRPEGFKTVSFSDAPLLASRSAMYASYQYQHIQMIIHNCTKLQKADASNATLSSVNGVLVGS